MGRSAEHPVSPFGTLIEEARAQGVRKRPATEGYSGSGSQRLPVRFELHFQTELAGGASGEVRSRRSVALPASLALHGAALAALLVVPLLLSDTMPDPASSVRAFFVEPAAVAPPPPPPPPPAPRSTVVRAQTTVAPPTTSTFTAPIEIPTETKPDEGIDLGVAGGVAGGVEGGVPGGVVGGVVGGLPDVAPKIAPVRVGGLIKAPKRLKYVEPVYPVFALQARVQGIIIIEATVDASGRVSDATVLRGIPILDQAALDAVRQWVYTPTLLNGVPTPILMTVTVTFQLRQS